MPWLAHAIPEATERDDALLRRPCSCCADPACACVAAYCRDSRACTRCCRCARCRRAWRSTTAHPVDDARRRIASGALWYGARRRDDAA